MITITQKVRLSDVIVKLSALDNSCKILMSDIYNNIYCIAKEDIVSILYKDDYLTVEFNQIDNQIGG